MTTDKPPSINLRNKIILLYLIVFGVHRTRAADAVFHFPEYGYKENNKNELTFREFETSCEQSPRCDTLNGVERVRCTRQCISPSCYHEIYQFDELEEGEIDVRLNSFKGCFIQAYRSQANMT
ncbi:unnamed protein product [Hermetia illucens]|uniref:Uncharacterized protein n=1 Tax=Hermetia illucens TaxID=343691 RepID=A0A7R8YRW8_HERIL|nr:uncharacterized protein LOC119650225 [Hermetia illucens]CAD7083148.1 unnamed protein product [Hermetia illucens]